MTPSTTWVPRAATRHIAMLRCVLPHLLPTNHVRNADCRDWSTRAHLDRCWLRLAPRKLSAHARTFRTRVTAEASTTAAAIERLGPGRVFDDAVFGDDVRQQGWIVEDSEAIASSCTNRHATPRTHHGQALTVTSVVSEAVQSEKDVSSSRYARTTYVPGALTSIVPPLVPGSGDVSTFSWGDILR